jgi:hypothetical protein
MRIGLSQVRIPPYGFFLTRLPVDFILKYCGFNPSMGILLRAIPGDTNFHFRLLKQLALVNARSVCVPWVSCPLGSLG